MPLVIETVKKIFGKEPHKGVNPDEVVAEGAAIQAGVLTGEVKDVLLLDVTPLTLGIETLGEIRTSLIDRNTTIPTKKSQIFSTAADNQPAVTINVLQGERQMARDNKSLGKFDLVGIPPAPRGIPQIEVTFDIDANGIVHVSAKDLGTGKEQSIKITSQKMSEEEIEKAVREAKAKEAEDKKRKEEVEVRNQADTLVYTTEKSLKDYGDKVSASEKKKIEDALTNLKEALKGKDIEKIKKASEEVGKASHKLAEEVYKEAQEKAAEQAKKAQPPPGRGPAEAEEEKPKENKSKKREDIVDAEYKEEEGREEKKE